MGERIMMLTIFEPGTYHDRAVANKRGLREAFERIGHTLELDYLAIPSSERGETIFRTIGEFEPSLLFTQIQGPDALSVADLLRIREYYPTLPIVNWNGDVWERGLTTPEMLDILHCVDLQLVINASVLPLYADAGIRAAFWPFGYEPYSTPLPRNVPAFDVVYLANNYSEHRNELGKLLRSLPYRVGLYGGGWTLLDGDGENTYDFTMGEALYRNAKLTISDNQFPSAAGYLSNRIFQAMAAGCFVLQQYVTEIERYTGFVDGVHYIGFREMSELPGLIDKWLADDERRGQIAANGQRFVQAAHNFDVRVRTLFNELLPEVSRV
jgi:hypothetical protein